ncbi:MAG: hypothetical protein HKN64_05395 [Woeseiaceae bacterium]|nr:hypothetical protein [Woeseiaceae bacterium]
MNSGSVWIVTSKLSNKKMPASVIAALLLLPMLVLLIADRVIAPHYRLALNESESLPGTVYLVKTGDLPRCGAAIGEHVQFQMLSDARWYTGERMLKVAKGCPGDLVRIEGRKVYINNWFAGEAVPTLEDGTAMTVISAGVIPAGHFYMWASHPSSFDSRYAEFSLISEQQIIGAARKIF